MFSKKREKLLFSVVLISVLIFGVSYLYQQYGDTFTLFTEDSENLIQQIENLQKKKAAKVAIERRYDEMENELTLEGNDSEQMLTIQRNLQNIFREVGLEGKYRSVTPKDPSKEPDFKIFSISVDQITCSPRELGNLLYRLEKQSEVMEVEYCQIVNQKNDTGQIGRGFGFNDLSSQQGLLSVDLQISRLVEYREGEERPRKRGRR